MIAFPPCKINLGLNIIRKRSDGYHDIETCFYPIPFCDVLEVIRSDTFAFTSSGNEIPGASSDNLCVRAYSLLKQDYNLPDVNIHLHKLIPAGAGLGGGSADAAFTLRLINDVFDLNLSLSKLAAYAAKLGSDCSFFIYNSPMIGRGRGEVLDPVSVALSGYYFVLLNPGVHVSTALAYSAVVPAQPAVHIKEVVVGPVQDWKSDLVNDFEISVFKKFPEIGTIKEALYSCGAMYASMSGSGSSVFGIFREATTLPLHLENNIIWKGILP